MTPVNVGVVPLRSIVPPRVAEKAVVTVSKATALAKIEEYPIEDTPIEQPVIRTPPFIDCEAKLWGVKLLRVAPT